LSSTSYQEASGATSELKDKLGEALASAKAERERLEAQLTGANTELMQAQTLNREKELQFVGLSTSKKSLEEQVQSLQQELRVYREKGSDTIKEIQARVQPPFLVPAGCIGLRRI
jgi:predicted  nucleic acid-binding Zn-ribbon protein